MLRIDRLTKTYRDGTRALKQLTLDAPPGILGLLGPNGAGKSTFMKLLSTLLEPDAGTATLDGVDLINEPDRARRIIGYLPQEFGFHPSLTALETLDYLARLKGMSDHPARAKAIRRLLDAVNLASVADRRVETFSGGMRQRLGIAQALIAKPALIIVDEPTAGLDPAERNRFHGMLGEAARDGAVVIFSTHVVSDVATLCDRLAIVAKGRLLAHCTPGDALAAAPTLEAFYFNVLERAASDTAAA